MLREFIDINKRLSQYVDGFVVRPNDDKTVLKEFIANISNTELVADVGGGKKPAKIMVGAEGAVGARYDGFDLSLDELLQAEDIYSSVYALDITEPNEVCQEKYHKIICRSTLEHVLDTEKAIFSLSKMLRDGGQLYICVPYRFAIFAIVNRILPNEFKKRMLHYIFPKKCGDGFPAYYLDCTLSRMERVAAKSGLAKTPDTVNKVYMSSYFTFLFPLYLIWRILTIFQYAFDRDYCERFEVVFEKKLKSLSESRAENRTLS